MLITKACLKHTRTPPTRRSIFEMIQCSVAADGRFPRLLDAQPWSRADARDRFRSLALTFYFWGYSLIPLCCGSHHLCKQPASSNPMEAGNAEGFGYTVYPELMPHCLFQRAAGFAQCFTGASVVTIARSSMHIVPRRDSILALPTCAWLLARLLVHSSSRLPLFRDSPPAMASEEPLQVFPRFRNEKTLR